MAPQTRSGSSTTIVPPVAADPSDTGSDKVPIVWALRYTSKCIEEKKEDNTSASTDGKKSSEKASKKYTEDQEDSTDVKKPREETVEKSTENQEDPEYKPNDDEDGDKDDEETKGSKAKTTKPRMTTKQLEWVLLSIHGSLGQDKVLEDRSPVKDLDFGHYGQPENFKPDFEDDWFLIDRNVLGHMAQPRNSDMFRSRPSDVALGSRDAAPTWLAKVRNVVFVCSDAATMYTYIVAILNIRHPPSFTKHASREILEGLRDLPRAVSFVSAPFRCDHEDCAVQYRRLTRDTRVIGTKAVGRCPWWAYADFCFRDQSTICIRDFPHQKDTLFEKGISFSTADTVAAWAISVFLHVAGLPDLREIDNSEPEPEPKLWGKPDTPLAENPNRYLEILNANEADKLAKLVLKGGCNERECFENARTAHLQQYKDAILNGGRCPDCRMHFSGADCRFRLHAPLALPRSEHTHMSFLHYGCTHNHSEPCERHLKCGADREEALNNGKNGTRDPEIAKQKKLQAKTMGKPRGRRPKRKNGAEDAAAPNNGASGDDAAGGSVPAPAGADGGAGGGDESGSDAGPPPPKKAKLEKPTPKGSTSEDSPGSRPRGNGSGAATNSGDSANANADANANHNDTNTNTNTTHTTHTNNTTNTTEPTMAANAEEHASAEQAGTNNNNNNNSTTADTTNAADHPQRCSHCGRSCGCPAEPAGSGDAKTKNKKKNDDNDDEEDIYN